jgi:hypothetical protein
MNIDLRSNNKARYSFYIAGLLVLFSLCYYIYTDIINPAPAITNGVPAQTIKVSQNKGNNTREAGVQKLAMDTENVLANNPFIELHANAVSGKQNVSMGVSMPVGNAGLPQIPGAFPRPNLPSIPLPAIPNAVQGMETPQPGPAMPAGTSNGAGVKGVLTSPEGKNMAIMGDGKVVSEGDTYQDGRIAYIGGDGVSFDDGRTISYK